MSKYFTFILVLFSLYSCNQKNTSPVHEEINISEQNENQHSEDMYPPVFDENAVGNYPAFVKSGGGLVWDEVLEYRVWCHPENGAADLENGDDYYYAFSNYQDALKFSLENKGTEEPIALILQKEYINETEPGVYVHVKKERLTEWPVEFLTRPRRTEHTIPDFFSPNAPPNRLDIIRGADQ